MNFLFNTEIKFYTFSRAVLSWIHHKMWSKSIDWNSCKMYHWSVPPVLTWRYSVNHWCLEPMTMALWSHILYALKDTYIIKLKFYYSNGWPTIHMECMGVVKSSSSEHWKHYISTKNCLNISFQLSKTVKSNIHSIIFQQNIVSFISQQAKMDLNTKYLPKQMTIKISK